MRSAIVFVIVIFASCVLPVTAQDSEAERLAKAAVVLNEILASSDRGLPEEVLEHATCVGIVPHIVKGGFVFGAENGKGVATCRTTHGWSAPVFFTINGGSWGLQIGMDGVDLVMVFQNDEGMKHLLEGKFKIGADASAAAGPVGRHASADTDWKMNAEVLTYSRAKGVFAGLTLNGAVLSPDEEAMQAEYGSTVTTRAVLRGEVPPSHAARPLLSAIDKASAHHATDPGIDHTPNPDVDFTPKQSVRAFLFDSEGEEKGFGLYSYLLFSSPPDENSKPRYLAILRELLRLGPSDEQVKWISPRDLNVTYIPVKNERRATLGIETAERILSPDAYNYSRARALLNNLPKEQRDRIRTYGIYLISVAKPLSPSVLNPQEHLLYQDLSTVPPEVAAAWIYQFQVQASRTDFWEMQGFESFGLNLRTNIARAAAAIDPAKQAAQQWQDLLSTLIFWKGEKK